MSPGPIFPFSLCCQFSDIHSKDSLQLLSFLDLYMQLSLSKCICLSPHFEPSACPCLPSAFDYHCLFEIMPNILCFRVYQRLAYISILETETGCFSLYSSVAFMPQFPFFHPCFLLTASGFLNLALFNSVNISCKSVLKRNKFIISVQIKESLSECNCTAHYLVFI